MTIISDMKAEEVLKITGIRRETLYRLVRKGKIRAERMPNGRYVYNDDDILRYAGKKREQLHVIYARVSTAKQKADLSNQISQLENWCAVRGYKTDMTFSDIASGIDFEGRKHFFELIDMVIQYKVAKVFVTHKDRLSRVGFGMFRHLFHQYGCQIEVVHESGNEKLDSEEIFEEIITLIHCFSMRHYSKRRMKKMREIITDEKDTEKEDQRTDAGAV